MTLTKIVRGDTYRITNTFYSGSTATWPISANVTWYDPNGNAIFTDRSGLRTSTTGLFYYYVSTNSSHDLGIWVAEWTGKMDYGTIFGNLPETYRNVYQVVKVLQ